MSYIIFKSYRMDSIYKLIKNYYLENHIDDSHGFSHAVEVEKIALNIANILNFIDDDENLLKIRLDALLHDIDDSKYVDDVKTKS